ncbi:MAG: ComF family protein [Sulfitobacter litoralis]|uniref:Predicted amidophosphoribosyltransferases n=1 Tax=Sulfitobacter litoralis TaxID=335975 RepID=A0ABY0S8K7_9RHOB|nr:ComF family protein [Sulfitobacter litoralis]MBQ0716147.1 ComF family protein [Sulfitobacter litoralis]SDO92088.1 Predicted amidophosphoribosyltransferases [Sulfitobacter litoralis]|tara:strand:+ start:1077 stop:1805 length:729 start_codon:yes stop_codon:yes gene_type:complete
MRGQLQTAVALIYPPSCLACGAPVDGDGGLCGPCWRDTAFIDGVVCETCGVPLLGDGADGDALCDACLAHPPLWDHGRAALLYRETGRRLVLALKHGDRQDIAKPAGRWMARVIVPFVTPTTLVIPVPLHWSRLWKRRFNQSALLAKAIARERGLGWCPDALRRVRRTQSLDGKGRGERFAHLDGAITAHPRRAHVMAGRPVLLVDDVMTSGATLQAAASACLAVGAGPICIVTLARVAKDT